MIKLGFGPATFEWHSWLMLTAIPAVLLPGSWALADLIDRRIGRALGAEPPQGAAPGAESSEGLGAQDRDP